MLVLSGQHSDQFRSWSKPLRSDCNLDFYRFPPIKHDQTLGSFALDDARPSCSFATKLKKKKKKKKLDAPVASYSAPAARRASVNVCAGTFLTSSPFREA